MTGKTLKHTDFVNQKATSLVALGIPFLFFIIIILFPRPYTVFFTDAEPDLYYGSRLVLNGLQTYDMAHPGIPSKYIGAFVMLIMGSGIQNTQMFFYAGYFLLAIITSLTMYLFARKILHNQNFGISLLSMVVFFCFSPVLTYSDMFSTGSFIFIFAYLSLTFFWIALNETDARSICKYYCLTGLFLGFSLANHVGALLLLTIIFFVGFIHMLTIEKSIVKKVLTFSLLPITTLFSYLLITITYFNRYPDIWANIFKLNSIRPSFKRLFNGITVLTESAYLLPETITQVVIGILFLMTTAIILLRIIRKKNSVFKKNSLVEALLIGLVFIALVYILSTTIPYGPPGITIRYGLFFASGFSFALIFVTKYLPSTIQNSKPLNTSLIFLSLIIFISSITGYMKIRDNLIKERTEILRVNEVYFNTFQDNGKRIAFWDGSPGIFFGEESFHFWGNYRYGNDVFTEDLLDAFPDFTFLRLREAWWLIDGQEASCRYTFLNSESFWRKWWEIFPPPCNARNNEIIAGSSNGVAVEMIVFPKDQLSELMNNSFESFQLLLEKNLDSNLIRNQVSINGLEWIVLINP